MNWRWISLQDSGIRAGRPGTAGVFVGTDHRKEGVGEHREGDPAGPGRVAADLVLIKSRQPLPGLEGLSTRHLEPATLTSMASGAGWGE